MSLFDRISNSIQVRSTVSKVVPIDLEKLHVFHKVAEVIPKGQYSLNGSPVIGGLTLEDARRISEEAQGQEFSRKNLWLLEVYSELSGGLYDVPHLFNVFATEISYSPSTVMNGDVVKIGGSNLDTVQSVEPGEISITTFDDKQGTLKQWFEAHHRAAVSTDGTVSEPAKYAIKIRIVHGSLNRFWGNFENVRLVRPVSLETTLSRTEDGLEELQMTFAQLDSFLRP